MANFKVPTIGKSDKVKGVASTNPSGAAQMPKSGGFSLSSLFSFGGKKPKPAATQQTATQTGLSAQGPGTKSPVGSKTITTPALGAATATTKGAAAKVKAPFKIPLIGGKSVQAQLQVLGPLALLFLALSGGSAVWDAISYRNNSTYINIASQLQFHTQRLAKSAGLAAHGDATSFPQLQNSRDEFGNFVKVLNSGGVAFNTNVPSAASNEELRSLLVDLTKRDEEVSGYADAILSARQDLTALTGNIAQVRSGSEDLAILSQEITGLMQQTGVPAAQVLRASRLTFLSERLGRGAAEILGADTIDPEVPFLMGKDTNDFRELIKALESGSEALGIAQSVKPTPRPKWAN